MNKENDRRSVSQNNETDSFGSRLKLAIGDESTNKFAKKCGIKESSIRGYFSGSTPGLDKVVAIAAASGVSISWLATGEGEMRPGANRYQTTANDTYLEAAGDQSAKERNVVREDQASTYIKERFGDYDYVTLYDAECSAGGGSWNEGCQPITRLAFTKYSLNKKGLDAKTLSAIRVAGDSMEGDLSDGDAVMIDHSKIDVKGEGIYVIRMDGHLYAKRLQRTYDGVEIISTNKAYKTTHVPKERLNELDVIGQVVWAASWTI